MIKLLESAECLRNGRLNQGDGDFDSKVTRCPIDESNTKTSDNGLMYYISF